jgi:hypothetical protein
MAAAIFSSSLLEGTSPKTSSPILAFVMASNMAAEGFVTVSDLKSMIIWKIYRKNSQFTPQK